jgi:cytochrome c
MRRIFLLLVVLGAVGVVALMSVAVPASGEAPGESAMKEALARGKALWNQSWAPNQKSCATCHNAGPNKLIAQRVKGYPRWDKAMNRVVSAQQKINQMVVEKARGQALELGSDDLNALEAHLSTLK